MKRPFPFEVHDKSFYRSLRALRERGEVEDFEVRGERHIALPVGKSKEDRELLRTTRQLVGMVGDLARARGLPESAVKELARGADPDEFKHHIFSGGQE